MDEQLKRIALLIQYRRFADAREALIPYLDAHPDSAPAWYMLSFASNSLPEKVSAARRAASLDPGSEQFRERVSTLEREPLRIRMPRRRRSGCRVLAVILVLLIVAGIAAAAWWFSQEPGENTPPPTVTSMFAPP